MTTPTFRKHLSGVISGLSLGTRLPNLKFVSLAVLELLAFNAQKFTGSRDHDHAHFSETFVRGHVGTIPGTRLPNLKFVSLAVSELLAFNSQKITGSRDWPRTLLPYFHIQGLAASKTRSLNYEPLKLVHRWCQRSISSLPLKMHYVGANLG